MRYLRSYEHFITARKRSLGQGNIFSSVCQEFYPRGGVCLSACWDTTPARQTLPHLARRPPLPGKADPHPTPGKADPPARRPPGKADTPLARQTPPWQGRHPLARQTPLSCAVHAGRSCAALKR